MLCETKLLLAPGAPPACRSAAPLRSLPELVVLDHGTVGDQHFAHGGGEIARGARAGVGLDDPRLAVPARNNKDARIGDGPVRGPQGTVARRVRRSPRRPRFRPARHPRTWPCQPRQRVALERGRGTDAVHNGARVNASWSREIFTPAERLRRGKLRRETPSTKNQPHGPGSRRAAPRECGGWRGLVRRLQQRRQDWCTSRLRCVWWGNPSCAEPLPSPSGACGRGALRRASGAGKRRQVPVLLCPRWYHRRRHFRTPPPPALRARRTLPVPVRAPVPCRPNAQCARCASRGRNRAPRSSAAAGSA